MLHPIGGLSKKLNTSVEDMLANVRIQQAEILFLALPAGDQGSLD